MERIYEGNFGEIEKLVDENMIEGHPYADLYKYIRLTNMETLRKNCIRRTLADKLENTRNQIERAFDKNCEKDIDLSTQPYLMKPYAKVVKKYSNEMGQLKTIDNHEDFEKMVERIYSEVMKKINESPKLVQEEIEKLYNRIIEECEESLNSTKYRGQYLIEETDGEKKETINQQAVKELTDKISDRDLDAFIMLEQAERKKQKLATECLELNDIINNSQNAVFTYLLKKVREKIDNLENIISEQLPKNNHLAKKLLEDNIIVFENGKMDINLNLDRLAELNIKGNEFDFFNVWCRLKLAEEYLKSNIDEEYTEDIKRGKRKVIRLKDYFELPDFEQMDPKNIKTILDMLTEKFRKKKRREYNECTAAIANIRKNTELFKTQTIKELEQEADTNIITITMPTANGMISRRNALYIVKTLIIINKKNDELNSFLNKENIAKLPASEENYIFNTISELLYEHVMEDSEKQKIKKIGTKGEAYEK